MPDIFINTQRPVDRSIVAGINQPQREAPVGAFVAGSTYDTNLYFVLNDGTYDAASGAAGQDVQVAISTISEPESGDFTLTDGTDTTAAIAYGATAQAVEDALNALNTDTGPNGSLVDVVKQSNTQYTVTFRTLGAQTAISGSTVSLFPESTPTGSIAVTGDGSTYAQQVIELTRQPAIYQQTWSTITNGFNGELALNTTRLLQSLVLEAGEPFYIEVKLNGETVAREVVGMELSTMPASAFSGVAVANLLDEFAADPTSNAAFDAAAWAAEIAAGGTVVSVNGEVGVVVLDMDDFAETATNKILTSAERAEIASNTASSHAAVTVSDSAEIDFTLAGQDITASLIASSIDETKLDASTNASLDLADSASQPGHTHVASDVTDFDTEVSNNTDVAANTAARHDAVTIAASGGRDYVTISGNQQLTLHDVDLESEVTGDLPVADGGTGASDAATARTNLDVDQAGTDNSTDVTIAGEDYLSLAGQAITANAIDLDNLSATGTPSATSFLRGDNTWAVPEGTGGGGGGETAETSIWIDAGALLPDATAEASSKTGTNGNVDVILMANTEKVYAKWTPPPQWDGGDISVDLYWTATGATAGHKVKWNVAAQAGGNDDAWDTAFPTPTATADDEVIASGDIHIIPASAITVGGTPADGDCVFLEIERTASGATQMSQEAELLGVRVNYENSLIQNWYISKMGSEADDASGTGEKTAWVAPAAGKIHAVHSGCSTATAGGALTVDVQKGGTTILSTMGIIDSTETSTSTGTAHVLTTTPTTFVAGDRISFLINTFGGTGAKGLHTDLLISWD